ncbi:MAG: EAL domain-containing protein [Gammaproteobacteria bacterium]
MNWLNPRKSLRLKLVLGSLVVQIIILTLLVANSVRLIENSLIEQAQVRLGEIAGLLNASLAAPLAQRNYATLSDVLNENRRKNGIVYLVLFDADERIVSAAGWDTNQPLPRLDSRIAYHDDDLPPRFDTKITVSIGERDYGTLRYGISTRFLTDARSRFIKESFLIALAAVGLSTLLLTLLGYWLTRHLKELMRAGEAVTAGNFDIRVPVRTRDEIGQLTTTFNNMAAAVRKRVEELSEGEAKFHAIADYTYGWENWYSPGGKLIWVNASVERITGYTPAECLQMHNFPLPIIFPEDYPKVSAEFKRASRGSVTNDFEYRIIHKQGAVLWVSASWQPIYGQQGKNLGLRSSVRDIYERKQMEQMLEGKVSELTRSEDMQRRFLMQAQQEHARLTSLLSVMNIGILFVSVDNRVVYYNPAFLLIWTISAETALIGEPATEILNGSSKLLIKPEHFTKHIAHILNATQDSDSFEIPMTDGRVVTQLSYVVRDEQESFIGHLWVYEDITRERQTAEQLNYLAEHDSLTGLYNRHRFQDDLERAIVGAERGNSSIALLFFDLDGFKHVNDTFGHGAGDTILIRVANEMSTLVRRNEILGRLGGDEFAILAAGVTVDQAEALAERIIHAVGQISFCLGEKTVSLTASVGIAISPQHATAAEELIAHADTAMYRAKEAGKNTWRVYSQDLDNAHQIVSHLLWNDRITHALENNLLRLHFQGIYHARDSSLCYLEVLVRMVDEENIEQLIMPDRFIPFAEKSGKILEIDRWVIHETIALLASSDNILPLAVNLSGRSFDDPSLSHYIHAQLQHYKVAANRLHIELTETAAISDLQDAQRLIEALHRIGCTVSLDDFGAGFSSFTYLRHLEADILKIDGSFIRNLPNDSDNQVFVKALVDIAHGLDKITVAEFVDSAETLEILQRFGIDMVQGYYLDVPRADHWAIKQAKSSEDQAIALAPKPL